MRRLLQNASVFLAMLLANSALANDSGLEYGANPHLDTLFATLQTEDGAGAESEVLLLFRKSGSDAMDLLLARGYGAMDAGQFSDAVWHFSALIDHAPEFAEGYHGRATAFYEMGELGLAMQDVEMALSYNTRHFVALTGMGFIQEELGHLDAALAAYKAAQSLNPHFAGIDEAIERVETRVSILH